MADAVMSQPLQWNTTRHACCGRITVPCAEGIPVVIDHAAGRDQRGGIRPNTPGQLRMKRLAWPWIWLHNQWFVTGFLERGLGRWMRQFLTGDSVFLEIGAGDMSLRRFMPGNAWYNALDIAYSQFALQRVLRPGARVNLVIASVTSIPLRSGCVDMIACKEVFMYLPEPARALDEIRRVLRPGGKFLCTIGNVNSRKYQVKGVPPEFVNAFGFEQFNVLVQSRGFRCVQAYQRGWWVPLPAWLTTITHQLPITSAAERDNTNFVYCFEAV